MNWHALQELEFNGRVYGMKDRQFPYFERLPSLVDGPLEIAVEGRDIPTERLRELGWNVVSALDATASYDDYLSYIARSSAEFSVVKDVYYGLRIGWFSDRSADLPGPRSARRRTGQRHRWPTCPSGKGCSRWQTSMRRLPRSETSPPTPCVTAPLPVASPSSISTARSCSAGSWPISASSPQPALRPWRNDRHDTVHHHWVLAAERFVHCGGVAGEPVRTHPDAVRADRRRCGDPATAISTR